MPAGWPQTVHDFQFLPLLVRIMRAILMFGKSTATCAVKQHEERQTMLVLHLEMVCLQPNISKN